MNQELATLGHHVNVVAINQIGYDSSQSSLSALCSFDLLQDTASVRAWDLMGGHKDDIFIFRPGGTLAPGGFLPISLSTYLHTSSGYANLRDRVIAADELGAETCTTCAFGVEKGVAKLKNDELSLKLKNAPFNAGIDAYLGDGDEIAVSVNGESVFAGPDRVVKRNGRGTKVTVKSSLGKAIFNLGKKTLSLKLRRLPPPVGDETPGTPQATIELVVSFAQIEASATVIATGKSWRKLLLEPGVGAALPTPEFSPCP